MNDDINKMTIKQFLEIPRRNWDEDVGEFDYFALQTNSRFGFSLYGLRSGEGRKMLV